MFTASSDIANISTTTSPNQSLQGHPPVPTNISIPDGCFEIRFDQMDFIPWNNADNIISLQTGLLVRAVKDNLLALLFLIGFPANVLNMAVFAAQSLRDRVNLALFSLSLADTLYLTQALILHGEQLHLQHTTREVYGPITSFMANHNLVGLYGFQWVSQILSATIATERCLCIFNPLRFQTLLRTRTMAAFIIVMSVVVVGLFAVTAVRYRIACAFDPFSGTTFNMGVDGEFYTAHREFITYLDSFVFGAGIPGVVMVVVTITTVMTAVRLRQVVSWRSETSSSLSSREVALTRMLVGSSVLFIACVCPIAVLRFSLLFLPEMNAGRRNQNMYELVLWSLEISSYVNCTFTFFVYYAMGSRYRATLWALVRCRRVKQ